MKLRHAIIVYIATALLLTSMAKGDDPRLAVFNRVPRDFMPSVALYDITQDGSKEVDPGGDVSAALREAFSNQTTEVRRAIYMPSGEWKHSQTVYTPWRTGFQLLGAGFGMPPKVHPTMTGVRTVLVNDGIEGAMIEMRSESVFAGNFSLLGSGETRADIGLLINSPRRGLGVGKYYFLPITITDCKYAVQVGAESGTPNCDNLYFTILVVKGCEAAYHGVNKMGMSVVIGHLVNEQNKYGLFMDGGGQIDVQSSVTTHASTLLKIAKGAGTGKNNGHFRLGHVKADAQTENGFVAVDSEAPGPIRVVIDGGTHSNSNFNGTFARLAKGNVLEVEHFSSTFWNIEGEGTVTLRSCTIFVPEGEEYDPKNIFGDRTDGRIIDCKSITGRRLPDWPPDPAIEKLNSRWRSLEGTLYQIKEALKSFSESFVEPAQVREALK